MSRRDLEALSVELEDSLTGLFEVTSKTIHEWEKGSYFCIYGMASKRLRAILDVEREVLFLVTSMTISSKEQSRLHRKSLPFERPSRTACFLRRSR